MCHGGLEDFPPADDLTLFEGMERAARLGSARRRPRRERDDHARAHGARPRGRASTRCATGRRRGRSSRRPRRSGARSGSPRRRAARCTSCTCRRVRGVALVTEARARGVDVTCEVCPHHLILTEEDGERLGMIAKCAPPLRAASRDRGDVGGRRPRRGAHGRLRPLAGARERQARRRRLRRVGRDRRRPVDDGAAADRGRRGGSHPARRRRRAVRRGRGAAVRPAGQGPGRGRLRRGPRARGPRRHAGAVGRRAAPAPLLQPVHRLDAARARHPHDPARPDDQPGRPAGGRRGRSAG